MQSFACPLQRCSHGLQYNTRTGNQSYNPSKILVGWMSTMQPPQVINSIPRISLCCFSTCTLPCSSNEHLKTSVCEPRCNHLPYMSFLMSSGCFKSLTSTTKVESCCTSRGLCLAIFSSLMPGSRRISIIRKAEYLGGGVS